MAHLPSPKALSAAYLLLVGTYLLVHAWWISRGTARTWFLVASVGLGVLGVAMMGRVLMTYRRATGRWWPRSTDGWADGDET